MVQVSVLDAYSPLGGSADLVLVALIAVSLLRGSIFGALRRVRRRPPDRHGEPGDARLHLAAPDPGRLLDRTLRRDDRPRPLPRAVHLGRGDHRPLRFGTLALDFVIGEPAPAGAYLSGLPATVLLNLILTWPVYTFVRAALPARSIVLDRVHEVRLLG